MANEFASIRTITNSGMFQTIARLYNENKISGKGLENAVKKGYITRDQMHQIAKPLDLERK